ncbi:MAG: AsmA family protein [Sulfuriferula multivorans]|uniref:AsmA family protein n=1 Tax=Sulfuriferula multivorans TaxID=1559896 RepID=A0A7C9JVA0_9PROT|nr:AsmA family protein [Sulfuriferula multivorans]
MSRRPLIWLGLTLLVLAGLLLVVANISNWNWLRGPISQQVSDRTGRELSIRGDLEIHLGWPRTHVRMVEMTFANPDWAHEKNMITVQQVALDVAMAPLFRRHIVFDRVELDRAAVFLEKSVDGKKNWLLDRKQSDDQARIEINHLAVNDSRIDYRDPAEDTLLSAELLTSENSPDRAAQPLAFKVSGKYRGQALTAEGQGGSVLMLRDNTLPYRLKVTGRIGSTHLSADGRITNLLKLSNVDLDIGVRGDSLAQLYPLLGIVFPDTPRYNTRGHLLHEARWWRYEKFSGQVGNSDIAGTLQVDTGGKRPYLTATLNSSHLDFADLGPLVGASASPGTDRTAKQPAGRLLPAIPFRTGRWNRMDADVKLNAQSIKRAQSLPIHDLSTRLQLRDAVLTLDPLRFGVAGGTLAGTVKLDGSQQPIRAAADLKARKINIARLFPTVELNKTSIGQVNGDIDLKGRGDTVAAMLGSADGKLAMVIDGGEISKLMMETVSLHLLEMLQLKLTGDETIQIHCGIADFSVKQGVMQANTLVLDTNIVRINGNGQVNLGNEQLDLTVVPKTKKLSLVALRTPINVKGSFAEPQVGLDKGKLAMRGLGAVALGAINPLLALMPLIDTGSGKDSDCERLIGAAKKSEPVPSR